MTALPPGPNDRPVVQLMRWARDPTALLEECARKFGDIFTLRFPGYPPLIVLSAPAAIKEIFSGSSEDIVPAPFPPFMKPFLGEDSLFFLNGPRHLRERKLMLPPFHGERMEAYGELMRTMTDEVIDRWPIGVAFPIHGDMQALTLDVILKTVFGMSEGPNLVALRGLLERHSNLAKRSMRLSWLLTRLSLILTPGPLLDRLYRFSLEKHPVSSSWSVDLSALFPWREGVRLHRAIDAILFAEIARARAEGGRGREDILSMLVEARDEEGLPMSDRELRDEMMTILVAGHETSATSLCWFFHRVLREPAVMAALTAELAAAAQGGAISIKAAAKLEYLDAAIKETHRLQPVVPHAARVLERSQTVGGYELPKGVMVLPSIYLTQRRADLFEAPTRFSPDRFLGKRVSPYEYFPFGGGVRRCIGMAFATYQMKIVLAQIFSRVLLRAAPGVDVHVTLRNITLAPSGGMPVVAESRAPRGSLHPNLI